MWGTACVVEPEGGEAVKELGGKVEPLASCGCAWKDGGVKAVSARG